MKAGGEVSSDEVISMLSHYENLMNLVEAGRISINKDKNFDVHVNKDQVSFVHSMFHLSTKKKPFLSYRKVRVLLLLKPVDCDSPSAINFSWLLDLWTTRGNHLYPYCSYFSVADIFYFIQKVYFK